ncbi:MAG TPA: hypothetical protein VKT81_06900 [Bryobacteraceae bacterium]|nr:hypothetical protein [Bryobacteraceae bacterium]
MRHYEVGEWTDFARELLSGKQRVEMQEHLAAGCAECGKLLEFIRQVAGTAATEAAYETASKELAVSARQIFTQRQSRARWTERAVQALRVLAAHMTYDSALDLQPAGARANRAASRHMLYEAGDFCLDLRFDRERDSQQVMLVGQVANRQNPEYPVAKLPVLVLSGQKVITETASNEFGEFSLEYIPRANLRLSVPLSEAGVRIEVSLKRVMEEHES